MQITVEAHVTAPLETVWEAWTTPNLIKQWNAASMGWFCAKAEIDLHEGGGFFYRMETSHDSYDICGKFDRLRLLRFIECTLDDGRKVSIHFSENNSGTHVKETFEADASVTEAEQKQRWQSILNYFKKIVETDLLLN